VRRFRSALSLFGRALDDPQVTWLNDEIRELALPFGVARDLDVLLGSPAAQEIPEAARTDLGARRELAYDEVAAILRGHPWEQAWRLVERFRSHAPWRLVPDPPAVGTADATLQRRWRRLLRKGARLRELSATDRHRVRIEAKKLRYGAQFFAGLYPAATGTDPSDFAAVLGELQDALGALNDAHTRSMLLRSVGVPPLAPDEAALVEESVAAYARVAALTPFWTPPTDHA
jgi:CHAD domain-containing protein